MSMPRLSVGALAFALGVSSGPAAAQDFLERLARGAAERAAAATIDRVAGDLVRGATDRGRPGDATDQPAGAASGAAPRRSAAAPATDFAAPAPDNYSAALQGPRQLTFSQDLMENRRRVEEFSRYSCTACEGGRAYGAWIRHYVPSLWGQWVLEERVGSMSVGEKVDWDVPPLGGTGRLEVIGNQPVGEWPCRQVRWTITKRTGTPPRTETADRLGLFCQGPRGNGQGWYEVL